VCLELLLLKDEMFNSLTGLEFLLPFPIGLTTLKLGSGIASTLGTYDDSGESIFI
jgi:hypothetical protein